MTEWYRQPTMRVRKRFEERASIIFDRTAKEMQRDFSSMIARFAAKGRSGAGATIVEAVRIFEDRSATALDSALSEAGKLIEYRGRKWFAAMAGINDALTKHLARARETLDYPLRIGNRGGRPDDAANRRADELLQEVNDRLNARLRDFGNGWTAPLPKQWKDRHPFVWAVLLLIVGAIIGMAIAPLKNQLATNGASNSITTK